MSRRRRSSAPSSLPSLETISPRSAVAPGDDPPARSRIPASLLAIMDGRYITEARTAAVSAVSVRHLARPEASTLAILGSGVQARSHLEALAAVRRCERCASGARTPVAGHGSSTKWADTFSPAHRRPPAPRRPCRRRSDRARHVVAHAGPRRRLGRAGAHVISVGACRPDQREMAPELVARAPSRASIRAPPPWSNRVTSCIGIAEGRFGEAHVGGELGDVVAGRLAGRRGDDDITVFKSLGMAVEDVVAADSRVPARRRGRRRHPARAMNGTGPAFV